MTAPSRILTRRFSRSPGFRFFRGLAVVFLSAGLLVPSAVDAQAVRRLVWINHPAAAGIDLPVSDANGTVTRLSLEQVLLDNGYAAAQVDSFQVQPGRIAVFGQPGPRYRISAMLTVVEPDAEKQALPVPVPGDLTLSQALDFLRSRAAGPACAGCFVHLLELKTVRADTAIQTLFLDVEAHVIRPGAGRIAVSGPQAMPAGFLARLTGVRNRRVLDPRDLPEYRRMLLSTGLFSQVGDGRIDVTPEAMTAVFETENLPLHTFDGVLGWTSRAGGGGYLAGSARLRAWNLTGEGSLFNFFYERLRQDVSRLQLDHHVEFLGGTPFGVRAGLDFYQQDSTFQIRNFHVAPFLRLGPYTTAGFRLRSEKTAAAAGSIVDPASVRLTGVEIVHRAADDVLIPTRGSRLELRAEQGRKTVDGKAAGRSAEFYMYVQAYWPVTQRLIAVPTAEFATVRADVYTEQDFTRFGGAQSLRGFAEGQFSGLTTGWADLEARFLADRRTYLFVFGAAGRFTTLNPAASGTSPDWAGWQRSAGFGLADRTRLGLLRVSYAFSNQTRGAGGGQVHVSVRNGF